MTFSAIEQLYLKINADRRLNYTKLNVYYIIKSDTRRGMNGLFASASATASASFFICLFCNPYILCVCVDVFYSFE